MCYSLSILIRYQSKQSNWQLSCSTAPSQYQSITFITSNHNNKAEDGHYLYALLLWLPWGEVVSLSDPLFTA